MVTLSVIIPTFNASKYILETLNSILSQDYQDYEILIVDDKSTDNTLSIVSQVNSDKIRCFSNRKNHGGPSKPRNIGIKNAKGKYIAFCDSDDLYAEGRLNNAIDFLKDSPQLGLVFTNERKFDDHSGKDLGTFLNGYDKFWLMEKEEKKKERYIISSRDAYRCLFYENFIMPSGVTVPVEVFNDIGLFDENLKNSDDRDMWFRITKKYPIGFINDIGFKYRIRENSVSQRGPLLSKNKIKTIRKQLQLDIPDVLVDQCYRIIAEHYFNIGYYYQKKFCFQKARHYYLKSLKSKKNIKALKGLAVTIIGVKAFKKIKSDFMKD